jgi:hypothetical protein
MERDAGQHRQMKNFVRADDVRNQQRPMPMISQGADRVRERSPHQRHDEAQAEPAHERNGGNHPQPTQAEIHQQPEPCWHGVEIHDLEREADDRRCPDAAEQLPLPPVAQQDCVNRGKAAGNEHENRGVIEAHQHRARHGVRRQQVIDPAQRQQQHAGKSKHREASLPPAFAAAAADQENAQDAEHHCPREMCQRAHGIAESRNGQRVSVPVHRTS